MVRANFIGQRCILIPFAFQKGLQPSSISACMGRSHSFSFGFTLALMAGLRKLHRVPSRVLTFQPRFPDQLNGSSPFTLLDLPGETCLNYRQKLGQLSPKLGGFP